MNTARCKGYKDKGNSVPAFKVPFLVEEVSCMHLNSGERCDVSGVLETWREWVMFVDSAKTSGSSALLYQLGFPR